MGEFLKTLRPRYAHDNSDFLFFYVRGVKEGDVRMPRVSKTSIKQDLLDQLERNGTYGNQYIDLVNDYMALYEIKNLLIKDIKTRGVTVQYQNGQNQYGYKKNDSINELNKTNAQMLKIIDKLGLNPEKIETGDIDDEL